MKLGADFSQGLREFRVADTAKYAIRYDFYFEEVVAYNLIHW